MTQTSLFDLPESLRHRDEGIERAASHNARRLVEAREIAVEIAQRQGTVNADDVMLEWVRRGGKIHDFGNSMGGLFQDKRFIATGERIKSKRIHAHANELRVWKLA
jgi:hypothetical protein